MSHRTLGSLGWWVPLLTQREAVFHHSKHFAASAAVMGWSTEGGPSQTGFNTAVRYHSEPQN